MIDQIRPLLENIVDENFIDRMEENDSEDQSFVIYLTDDYTEDIVSEWVSEDTRGRFFCVMNTEEPSL